MAQLILANITPFTSSRIQSLLLVVLELLCEPFSYGGVFFLGLGLTAVMVIVPDNMPNRLVTTFLLTLSEVQRVYAAVQVEFPNCAQPCRISGFIAVARLGSFLDGNTTLNHWVDENLNSYSSMDFP